MFEESDTSQIIKPRHVMYMMILSCIATLFLTLIHYLEESPHILSLTMPPLMFMIFISLSIYLLSNPTRHITVLRIFFLSTYVVFAAGVWLFCIEAFYYSDKSLIETFPPATSVIFLITVGIVILFRSDQMLKIAIISWIIVALPVIIYFIYHIEELSNLRGIDILFSVGPAMGLYLIMLLFYSNLQKRLTVLSNERSSLKKLADTDSLTGLYNRRAGERFLLDLIENNSRKSAVLLFDIDRFKNINDLQGHDAGDKVLREVVTRCSLAIRKHDSFVRWGGDEFLILIRGAVRREIYGIADTLRETISKQPVEAIGPVTVSFGATSCLESDTMGSILKRVDDALYLAKNSGRNKVVIN